MANITRYSNQPLTFFEQMRRELDDAFGSWSARTPVLGMDTEKWFTPVDIHETDAEFVVKMDVPGMAEKDIKVSLQGDTLTLQGERRVEKTEAKGNVRYSERSVGSFMRSFAMPSPVRSEEIRARYKDGVVEVHLPKAQKTTSKEIKVEAGT